MKFNQSYCWINKKTKIIWNSVNFFAFVSGPKHPKLHCTAPHFVISLNSVRDEQSENSRELKPKSENCRAKKIPSPS